MWKRTAGKVLPPVALSNVTMGALERVIAYAVKTSRELEDSDVRNAVVWRVAPSSQQD